MAQEGRGSVSKGESIYEVEADKVTTEVESPASGVLKKILIPEGLEVPVFTPVGIIADEKEVLPEKYVCAAVRAPEKKAEVSAPDVRETPVILTSGPSEVKAPPAARKLARERGVDLSVIRGSGPGGTILLKDVESFTAGGAQASARVLATPTARKLAEREGVPISAVRGTGLSGRVMRADVVEAKAQPKPAEAT